MTPKPAWMFELMCHIIFRDDAIKACREPPVVAGPVILAAVAFSVEPIAHRDFACGLTSDASFFVVVDALFGPVFFWRRHILGIAASRYR
jgi:hypothetical protein